ncbi:cell division protein SepF [Clostridiaceae bacterium M8S5]|nr:cell division protein SepF [Clostridiaceae bacterium M8S5]
MSSEGLLSKVKYFIGLEDYEDDYEYEEEYLEEEQEIQTSKINMNNKVVNIHTNKNIKLVVHKPSKLEDSTTIVKDLKSRKPVVVNLIGLEDETKRSIFDFLNGALYALEGSIQKVTKDIFVLAPNNVDIDGNVEKEIKDKSTFSWLK